MSKVKTGIVMMNLGGPATLDEVEPFLLELFADREIIQLPFQSGSGPSSPGGARRKVRGLYASIGGGSPILRYTRAQGRGHGRAARPALARDRAAPVLRRLPLRQAEERGRAPRHAGRRRRARGGVHPVSPVLLQHHRLQPQRALARRRPDRPARRVPLEHHRPLAGAPGLRRRDDRDGARRASRSSIRRSADRAVLLFSAHSLPLDVIDRGDAYPQEVGATVQRVVERLGVTNRYLLAYQSDVGPVRWLGPSTEQVIRRLGARGEKRVLVVPIAFTSDHIETLSELDREYGEVAHQAGITHYKRAPALNDRARFLDALADIVREHLASGEVLQHPVSDALCRLHQLRNAGTC